MNELYAHERYRGFKIFIEKETNNTYYGSVYNNGTCYFDGIKSVSGDNCLDKCKRKVDELEDEL